MRKILSVAFLAMLLCAPASITRAEDAPNFVAVSDTQTEFSLDGQSWKPAVATWVHPAWPTLKGATWIWTVVEVSKDEAVHGSPVVTFRRKFTLPAGASTQATLQITGDNAYEATLNGQLIGSNGKLDAASDADQQWRNVDSYNVALQPGDNLLVVRAVNYHSPLGDSADSHSNPGGIVYGVALATPLAQTLAKTGKVEVYGILFDTDKTVIKPAGKPVLDEVAALLKNDPSLRLEVSGHTDNTGTKAHNQTLSEGRAKSVVDALVKTYGIDPKRLVAKGYGDTKPVAPNDSDADKAKNRRVELKKLG